LAPQSLDSHNLGEHLSAALRCYYEASMGGAEEGDREMKRFLTDLFDRVHARAEMHRKRALQQAAREMNRRETHGGSIWRSGKGGSHYG
jgi:hypothetical protein